MLNGGADVKSAPLAFLNFFDNMGDLDNLCLTFKRKNDKLGNSLMRI